jgi:hypothetical protein
LFDERKTILVIVELQYKDFIEKIRNSIKNIEFDNEEKRLINFDFDKTNYFWTHFALEKYELTEENIIHLSQFLSQKINESPLLRIYRKLNQL